jgi:L-ascorbate metabolism protein UlaG (beta-lactamase superfamily)
MNDKTRPSTNLSLRAIGGPTLLVELDGLRLLTDPTFDPPGDYDVGGRVLSKTAPPAVGIDEIGQIDAVLLSHDQHVDNLDTAGRAFLDRVPIVLSTPSASTHIGNVTALPPWSSTELRRRDSSPLLVTAVPAQHGPDGTEHTVGEVIGFVLTGHGVPTVYISGDNASLRVVDEIAARVGPIDIAVLHAGAARTPLVDGYLTLTSEQAAAAAKRLGAADIIPVHYDSWRHYTQGADTLRACFARADLVSPLHLLAPGDRVAL